MNQLAKEVEKEGVRAITTSCGFNAIFQEALANAVNIPVFTSFAAGTLCTGTGGP